MKTPFSFQKRIQMKLLKINRILVLLSALTMSLGYVTSVWKIELDAPQYPEGLKLEIWVNALKGDVDSINNLNHYIGMKTLHANEFWEFTILPYVLGFMIVFGILVFIFNTRNWLGTYITTLLAIAAFASYDFWRWEYDYGHNLNPEAAIKIPGMAYQPPFLGYKQLLNFLAGSLPDTGGIAIIGASVVLGSIFYYERFVRNKK